MSVLRMGFDQPIYLVNMLVDSVEVCANVSGGVVLDREVVVQYWIKGKTELYKECMFNFFPRNVTITND